MRGGASPESVRANKLNAWVIAIVLHEEVLAVGHSRRLQDEALGRKFPEEARGRRDGEALLLDLLGDAGVLRS
jgi:hypothetical protein